MFTSPEREYLESAPIARLATVDGENQPHIIPICYALCDETLVTVIDEKPKQSDPMELRRVRNIQTNPSVAVIVDHYESDWSNLGWLQLRGHGTVIQSQSDGHDEAIGALQAKYPQYNTHRLESRPVIRITPTTVRSWGQLDPTVFDRS